MSAIFGEVLTFGQGRYPDVQLRVRGDEFYASYETLDGYAAVSDRDKERFCYAVLHQGALVSSGVPVSEPPPVGIPRHLRDSGPVRAQRFAARRVKPARTASTTGAFRAASGAALTFAPSQGLLEGRRLSTGTVRGLTILVEFQDVRTTVSVADVDAMLNGADYTKNGNYCSAREYFRIVSSGKLDYTNRVVGPFRLSQNRSYYVQNLLVKEALDLAVASGVNLKEFDSRNEGIVDALNILYAGQTQYDGELWPHNYSLQLKYGNVSTDLYLLTSAGRSPDDLSIGTFCHENGHLLCRFPDMYDYGEREGDNVPSAGIGCYCLMGSGNHLNSGRTPSPVCSYLRDLAGWCDNEVIVNGLTNVTAEHGDYNTVIKYRTESPNEYFVIENRSKLGLDAYLPASGLAVYHCDILGSNEFQSGTATRHYQCALLQADGHRDLETNENQGDGTDLFGAVTGIAVSSTTSPSSRLWNGADSGLLLSNIGLPADTIPFRVGAAPVSSALTIHAENATATSIPDNNPTGIASVIKVDRTGVLKSLTVKVEVKHTYIGDLTITLQSPTGENVSLHSRTGGGTDDLSAAYDSSKLPGLAALVGSQVAGNWTLRIRDLESQDVGKLVRWSIDATIEGAAGVVTAEAKPAITIPDNDPAGIVSTLDINRSGTVAKVKVSVDITHTYIGDLRIQLVAPGGRTVLLHGQLGGSQDNLVITYDSSAPLSPLSALVGQGVLGTWSLRIADLAAEDVGKLNKWALEITPG